MLRCISFINNICLFRKAAGLTQQELADLVGLSSNAISDFECQKYQPSACTAALLCRALKVPFDGLFNGIFYSDSLDEAEMKAVIQSEDPGAGAAG